MFFPYGPIQRALFTVSQLKLVRSHIHNETKGNSMPIKTILAVLPLHMAIVTLGCSVTENGTAISMKTEPGPVDGNAPETFTTLPSGLKYRILRQTTGPTPKATDTVSCNYKGWLDDGSVFDSSYRKGQPIEFPLQGVVPGWTQGLQYVSEGGTIELEIPYHLGYGESGRPPVIPPKATLHFIVELERIL